MRKYHLSYDLRDKDKYGKFQNDLFTFLKQRKANSVSKTSETAIVINFEDLDKPSKFLNEFYKKFNNDMFFSLSVVAISIDKETKNKTEFYKENPNSNFKNFSDEYKKFPSPTQQGKKV